MNMGIEIMTVPALIAVVYEMINLYKQFVAKSDAKKIAYIPVIAGILGTIFAVGGFYIFPGFIPADNVFMAALIGAASGLASTGTNQIFKQMEKLGISVKNGGEEKK